MWKEVKEDEVGRACSTKWVKEECIWDTDGRASRKEITWKTKI
jgi:hypothetical protein